VPVVIAKLSQEFAASDTSVSLNITVEFVELHAKLVALLLEATLELLATEELEATQELLATEELEVTSMYWEHVMVVSLLVTQ